MDFHNGDSQGRLRLNCLGTVEDLAEQGTPLREGLLLTLYADYLDHLEIGDGVMKLSAAAKKVIELAQQVRDYYEVELPKWHPQYPLVGLDEKDPPAPPAEGALKDFLHSLPEEMVYQLAAIMYLGRGDFAADHLADYYPTLKSGFHSAATVVSQMMDKAPLADYLSDGLAVLKQYKINVDRLPLKEAAAK